MSSSHSCFPLKSLTWAKWTKLNYLTGHISIQQRKVNVVSFIPSVWFSEYVSPLQVTPGPSLHQSVQCGSTWMFSFPLPPSCTCALSPWTVMWPSGTPSDTIGQTPAPVPGPKSRPFGPSLQVQHVGKTCAVAWREAMIMKLLWTGHHSIWWVMTLIKFMIT